MLTRTLSVVAACVFLTCTPSKRSSEFWDTPLGSKEQEALRATLTERLDAVVAAADDAEIASSLRAQLALCQYARLVPVYHLMDVQSEFERAMEHSGVEPFVSFYVDYAQRLLMIGTKESMEHYRRLVGLYRADRHTRHFDRPVVIWRESRRAFRAYSGNLGWAVAALMSSAYAADNVHRRRMSTESALRTIALLLGCQRSEGDRTEAADSLAVASQRPRLDTCALLGELVYNRMDGRARGDINDALADIGHRGVTISGGDCVQALASNDPGAEMIARLEDYVACRVDAAQPGSFGTDWFADGSSPATEGFGEVHDPRYGDGLVWVYGSTEPGGTMVQEVIFDEGAFQRKEFTPDGKLKSLAFDDGKGNGYQMEYNTETGNPTRITVFEALPGGGQMSTENQYDAQGNLTGSRVTLTVDNGDGTVTETTTEYDANGNVVKTQSKTKPKTEGETEGEAPAEPNPDEVEASPCLRLLHDDPTQAGSMLTKLQTQIIPKPDAVQPSDDPCLSSFTTKPPDDCVSVLLCMEGAVDDSCRCDKPKPGVVANPYAATCASMICPDGTHCDPTTGVCVGGTPNNPLFLPGVRPDPIPMPFDGNIAIERGIQAGGLRLSTRLPVGGAGPPSTNR